MDLFSVFEVLIKSVSAVEVIVYGLGEKKRKGEKCSYVYLHDRLITFYRHIAGKLEFIYRSSLEIKAESYCCHGNCHIED